MLILNLMTVVHLRILGQAVHSHMHASWVHKHLGTQETSCHKSKETLKFWTLHSQPSNRQSCLTSVFTQGLKGSRTWGWWITGRWFRRLFCQQRREDSVRARAEEWLDYPDILGGTGGAVEVDRQVSFLSSFLSAHRPAWKSWERRLLQVSGLTGMLTGHSLRGLARAGLKTNH